MALGRGAALGKGCATNANSQRAQWVIWIQFCVSVFRFGSSVRLRGRGGAGRIGWMTAKHRRDGKDNNAARDIEPPPGIAGLLHCEPS